MTEATTSSPTSAGPQAWVFDFVLLAAIWGASFLFMRTASHEFGVFATAGLRTLIGALFLLPLLAKDSGLTACVDTAVTALKDNGKLAELQKTWLTDFNGLPALTP